MLASCAHWGRTINSHSYLYSLPPPTSETEALQSLTLHPFSDFLIHHMGKGLADDITQGAATGDMFRSAPLWGVGQRIFSLHDGSTDNLLQAIQEHASPAMECDDNGHRKSPCYGPSEANAVVRRFNELSAGDKQAVLDFLRCEVAPSRSRKLI